MAYYDDWIQKFKEDLHKLEKTLPEKVDSVVDAGNLARRVGDLAANMRKRMDMLEARQRQEAKDA